MHIPGLLSLRTLISKLISATFVLAAGLIAEGEAPFVHIGAIVGGGITSGGSRQALPGRRLHGYSVYERSALHASSAWGLLACLTSW